MRGMLIKDIRLMVRQKVFFVLLLFVAVMLNFNSESTFVIGYLTFVSAFFVISTMSYDEHANGYAFLMTLPVMRKTYVRAKYVFALLLGGSGWGAGVIISYLYLTLHGDIFSRVDYFAEAALLIPVLLFILSIMIPFQLKFGVEKGRIAILIFIGIIFAGGFVAGYFERTAGIMERLSLLETLGTGVLVLIFLFVSIVAVCISYVISCRIMCKREF